MNKSLITNLTAILLVITGFVTNNDIVKTVGLFAVSGAITNWIAVHMLFEKVPGFYGSGVIVLRFEEFKGGIRSLIMEQFFSQQNIARFMAHNASAANIDLRPVIEKVDLSPTFDSLIEVVKESSFGQMLGMLGGVAALEPMRQPFVEKMGMALSDISQDPKFVALIQEQLAKPDSFSNLQVNINNIVEQRLDELTPAMVKNIMQTMIKHHLGWLVVWGGVFGGFIGLFAAVFTSSF